VRENGAKAQAIQEYSPSWPKVKLQNKRLWIGGSCWGKGILIKFELTNKTWACKKNSSCKFSMLPIIKHLNQIRISLCPITYHKGAKRNTIGVVAWRANANLPHYMDLVLTYPMENKMPLVRHVVKRWRCGYKNEDDKGLSERTQEHPMLKPKSKFM
jgi:hypothetical protein